MKRCVMIVGFWLGFVGLGEALALGWINGLGRDRQGRKPPPEVLEAYETSRRHRTPEQQILVDSWCNGTYRPGLASQLQARREAEQRAAQQRAAREEALTRLAGGSGTPDDRALLNRWRLEQKTVAAGPSPSSTPDIPPTRIPALIEDLRSGNGRVRHAAAYQLRFAGAAAKEAVPGLLKALGDPDSDVRWVATGTLGTVGAGSPQVAAALARALRDSKPEVRRAAAAALVNILP
jgi:hypothetical protein